MDRVLRCSCVSATLTPYHQAHVGVEEFLVLKQRGQFAVGQRRTAGSSESFKASRHPARLPENTSGRRMSPSPASGQSACSTRWSRCTGEYSSQARPRAGHWRRRASPRGAAARCRRALHDGLDAEGRIQKVDARHGCPPLPVKKTEVAESGFGDGIHDAAEELDGPFDARRRRLPFGETGEKDNIALVHPPRTAAWDRRGR